MQFLAENKCSCLFVHPGNFKKLVKTATTEKKRLEDKRKKKKTGFVGIFEINWNQNTLAWQKF